MRRVINHVSPLVSILSLFLVSMFGVFGCAAPPPPSSETLPASTAVATPQSANSARMNLELITSAESGDLEAVKRLLASGASVQATDASGRTALIAAAYADHVEIGRALIEAGADVNVKDRTIQSAYLIPTADGSLEFLKLTLVNGADVHSLDSYNGTGLIRAAQRGHVEIIRELLKTDIKVDHVNNLGWTALLEAIILGDGGQNHTDVVQLLVDAGADVNLADKNGVTPLQHAKQRDYQGIVAILEQANAR